MTYYTRAQIGLRASRGRTALAPSYVLGVALHWPAMSRPVRGVESVKAALRNWQKHHMDTNGWSDIAYQEAVDQDGNAYDLRGLATRSAANGDTDVNQVYGAILLILAPGETPTEAMCATVRARVSRHREICPNSKFIVGHGAIRPGGTECPGPAARAALAAGRFHPSTKPPALPPKPELNRVQTGRNKIRWAATLFERADKQHNRPVVRRAAKQLRRILKRTPKS